MEAQEKNRDMLKERLTACFQGAPDVIFVLSGGIKKTRRGWESTSYSDEDAYGLLGGRARVIAAAAASQYFPEAKIVTTSHLPGEPITHAEVMKGELEKRGVSRDRILLETQSVSTQSKLKAMVELAIVNQWQGIAILTSDYHIPRTRELYEHLESLYGEDESFKDAYQKFKERGTRVVFVAAEDILPLLSRYYANLIKKVKETPAYQKRVEYEQRGVQDIHKGHYLSFNES